MVDMISTLGLQLVSSSNLSKGQALLSNLTQQLTTGKYSENLSDYSSSSAQKILNFNGTIDEQNGFLSVIETIAPRLTAYDSALSGVEDTASDAYSALLSASTYNVDTNASLQSTIKGAMEQISYYLNQQMGDRYLFSGTRYDQSPVISGEDMATLPMPPTEVSPYLATPPAVPAYDTDYNAASPADPYPEAYIQDAVRIDTTKTLTYGVTSEDQGFQQIVMGLRFALSATNDSANYQTYMNTARDLLSQGLANVRGTHTDVTNAATTLNNTQATITGNINNLKNQVDNIENVDINDVSVKITVLEAQLQASYAATAKMVNLSILDYL